MRSAVAAADDATSIWLSSAKTADVLGKAPESLGRRLVIFCWTADRRLFLRMLGNDWNRTTEDVSPPAAQQKVSAEQRWSILSWGSDRPTETERFLLLGKDVSWHHNTLQEVPLFLQELFDNRASRGIYSAGRFVSRWSTWASWKSWSQPTGSCDWSVPTGWAETKENTRNVVHVMQK